ncbi:MAG TPA: dethiobiotin synthase [Steroidobacteraceae bacterium]|jgi:dethiobiotin synthetase
MKGAFITGTDTGVGKTRVATALVDALARDGLQVAAMKPIAAGAVRTPDGLRNEDALALMQAANVPAAYDLVNPYCAELAASPHIALAKVGIVADLAKIRRAAERLGEEADLVIVEGAGGWQAPITDGLTMADVALALELPVVLVVGLRLGCLNHALLTAEAIELSGLHFAGWVGNHLQPHFEHASENITTLERRLRAPLLDVVAHGAQAFALRAAIDAARSALDASRASNAP